MPGRPIIPVMGGGLSLVSKSLIKAVNRQAWQLASPACGGKNGPAGFAQATRQAARTRRTPPRTRRGAYTRSTKVRLAGGNRPSQRRRLLTEELQDVFGIRICDRQRLDAELLLSLQSLEAGRLGVHIGIDKAADARVDRVMEL